MDAVRYGAMLLKEMNYLRMNDDGSRPQRSLTYGTKIDLDKKVQVRSYGTKVRPHFGI